MVPFTLKARLQFLLKSTNAHGVHSPFVFNFVTKCLYARRKWKLSKSIKVLLKSIAYFNAQSIAILDDLEVAQIVEGAFPGLIYNPQKFDVVFANQFDKFHFQELLSGGKLHNDSVIFVNHIHQNQKRAAEWESLIQSPKVTVSIDMYQIGAIFIRKEQAKEHFTIRI